MFCSVFCMRCLPACSVRIHQVQPEMFNAYHRPCSIVKGLQKNVLDFTGQETPTSDLPYFWSILHMMDTHFCKSSIAQGQPGSMLCVTCCRVGFVFPEAIIIWPHGHTGSSILRRNDTFNRARMFRACSICNPFSACVHYSNM